MRDYDNDDGDDDDEHMPFAHAGLPFSYGATVPTLAPAVAATAPLDDDSGSDIVVDGENDSRIYLRGQQDIAFGSWPWRALNRHVSWAGCLSQHHFVFITIFWRSGGGGRLKQPYVVAVLTSLTPANDWNGYKGTVRSGKPCFISLRNLKVLRYNISQCICIIHWCYQYHLLSDVSNTYTMYGIYFRVGRIIVGGNVVIGGSSDAADFLAHWMSNSSITTSAAMASTMGTARGTTQGSWRPRAASVPGVPSYRAVSCACEMVAGDLNPTLN
jgi:hypothetical protein